jgi:hypothetical protein
MAIWEKVRRELDDAARVTEDALKKAGKVAQEAVDEGRLRIDAFRARQSADRDAQAFGYAVFRARKAGTDLAVKTMNRLYDALMSHDAEAARLEAELAAMKNRRDTPVTVEEPPPAA